MNFISIRFDSNSRFHSVKTSLLFLLWYEKKFSFSFTFAKLSLLSFCESFPPKHGMNESLVDSFWVNKYCARRQQINSEKFSKKYTFFIIMFRVAKRFLIKKWKFYTIYTRKWLIDYFSSWLTTTRVVCWASAQERNIWMFPNRLFNKLFFSSLQQQQQPTKRKQESVTIQQHGSCLHHEIIVVVTKRLLPFDIQLKISLFFISNKKTTLSAKNFIRMNNANNDQRDEICIFI